VEKGRGNHTRRFDVPLELEKLTFDAHPTELLPEQNLNYYRPSEHRQTDNQYLVVR
jgi:hypothetical protein